MHSNPRITMAIQPEVFSRSFCSIGQECRDEAGQFTRMAQAGPTRAACAEAASPSGAGGYSARTVCARASDAASSRPGHRSEEHTSELQSLMRNSYAVFCLKKK